MPADSASLALDAEAFARVADVSRETLALLTLYADRLSEWNSLHNLVSRTSIEDMWRRHFLDSVQLMRFVPDEAASLVDLGSGAGFPGLVLATLLRDRRGFRTVLYESTGKKCRFLQETADALRVAVEIRQARIEDADAEGFDLVTARALAPLPELLVYAQRFFRPGTIALFPKGQNIGAELTQAHKSWKIEAIQHPSISDPSGVILEVRELKDVRRKQR